MRKTLIGISVLFYLFSYGQKDSLSVGESSSQYSEFRSKAQKESLRQKQEVLRLKAIGFKEFIEKDGNSKQLIGSDENGRPMYYTTLNAGAAKMTKADQLYSGVMPNNMSVTGRGMVIGQWDFAKPRINHELLSGKITYNTAQNQTISRHSTSIAGTMAGNNGDSNARGLAYDSTLKAYDWIDDLSEMGTEAYDPANNPSGILVANNSYGFDPMYLQTYQFGKYNATSRSWDNLMYLKPYLQIVKAVGNARGIDSSIVPQVTEKQGFDLLEGAGIAKNVLVVGSVKKNTNMNSDEDFAISNFSSYGPTDDGRIKPDVCAPGEDMYSSIDTYNSAYGVDKGTSSSTAVVSGIITLLQQYYKAVTPSSSYMLSSTVRALLSHTANDKGALGPDYIYGWGMVDAKRARDLIYNNIEGTTNNEKKTTLIKEVSLTQGNQYTLYAVPYDLTQAFSATIAWTDPQGNLVTSDIDLSSPNIINDLDLKIMRINSDGTETPYYPWKMGGMTNYSAPATRDSSNNVDTVERVDIDANVLQKATYKIMVSTKTKTVPLLPSGNQVFSLVVSNIDFCYMDDMRTLVSTADDYSSTQTIKAKNIIASNVVKSTAQGVDYIASNSIDLLPGFHAEKGAVFHAFITPCFDRISAMKYVAQQRLFSSDNPISTDNGAASSSNIEIYPNPAKEEVKINLKISSLSQIKISLFDQSGRLVLSNQSPERFPKGEYLKSIDTSMLSAGVYIVTVETADYKETKKLIIK